MRDHYEILFLKRKRILSWGRMFEEIGCLSFKIEKVWCREVKKLFPLGLLRNRTKSSKQLVANQQQTTDVTL